jgi:hypothetical protein
MLAGKSTAVVMRGASADRFVRWGLKAPPSLYVMPFFKAAIEEEAKTCMRCGDAEAIPPARLVLPGCISQISTLPTSEQEYQDDGGLSHVSHVGLSHFFRVLCPSLAGCCTWCATGATLPSQRTSRRCRSARAAPGSPRAGKPSP